MDNSNLPLVSIIFTSYNHQEYLREALNAIIRQTYKNIEIIVVDDNSTDGSQLILKEYQYDYRVSLHLLTKNTGSYVKASNYGAQFAKGDFLLFAQCDDFADHNQIETLLKPIQEYENIGVVYSKSNLIDSDGKFITDDYKGREYRFKRQCMENTIITGKQMRRYLSLSCVIPNLSAALIRKKLFIEVGKLSEKYLVASDWAFWLSLSEITNFYYIIIPLNNFRQHNTTIRSQIKISKQVMEIYEIMHKHIEAHKINGLEKLTMKINMGAITFAYFILNKRLNFPFLLNVLNATFRLEKLNCLFFVLGIFKSIYAYLMKLFVR